ncbi:MAG TPA: hypothetical protein VFH83_11595, partial [Spirochaetia bacterium]|nr:hypothetical protein [Spirochaetia bacterium]
MSAGVSRSDSPGSDAPGSDAPRSEASDKIRSEVTIQRSADSAQPPDQEEREERYYMAGQAQLIWMKFRRHKLAIVAMVVL